VDLQKQIQTRNYSVGYTLNRHAHHRFKNYSYNTTDINMEPNPNSIYQPGRNIKICVNDWTGRIVEHTFLITRGEDCEISTYTRGKKRLDYILTSQNLIPFINQAGYLSFFEANESDHRGLFVDVSNHLLDNKVELKRPSKRMIGSSSNGKEIYDYKQMVHQDAINKKLYERAKEAYVHTFLPKPPDNMEQVLAKIDRQISESVLRAERKCCPKRHES
jgi:hypothetical protein